MFVRVLNTVIYQAYKILYSRLFIEVSIFKRIMYIKTIIVVLELHFQGKVQQLKVQSCKLKKH